LSYIHRYEFGYALARHQGRQTASAGRRSLIVRGWLKQSKELPTLCLKQNRKGRVAHPSTQSKGGVFLLSLF
jgi:hypothetical protein